ncbi:hypothetical protein A2U01_0039937, partial [Trifolium medium]|nr:hypothetical protein [Trifolium medium]
MCLQEHVRISLPYCDRYGGDFAFGEQVKHHESYGGQHHDGDDHHGADGHGDDSDHDNHCGHG